MNKETVDVWIVTDLMFAPSRGEVLPETPSLKPFCFKDVRLSQTVFDLFKFVKSIRLIPNSIDLIHCFYFVQVHNVSPQQVQRQQENEKEQNGQMVDEEIQSATYEQQRNQIFEKIKKDSTIDEETRTDFQNFTFSLKKLLKYHLGDDYKSNVRQKNIQMRIYIMWKEATFQLKSNPKKTLTIPVVRGDTFDQLYTRALALCPQMHENLRRLSYTCGVNQQEYYFVKHRVYEDESKENEEENLNEQKKELPSKRSFKLCNPNSQIYKDGLFYGFRSLD